MTTTPRTGNTSFPRRLSRRTSTITTTLVVLLLVAGGTALADGSVDWDPQEWHDAQTPCRVDASTPVDVLFVFDTTGSMGSVLNSAKSGATNIMNNVRASYPGSSFGAAHYEDYPGYYPYPGYSTTYGNSGDVPWQLLQPITTSTSATDAAIGGLFAGGGADGPESLTRAVFETRADPDVAWRSGAVRIVVLFSDAPPHDLDFNGVNTGGDPGRNAIAGDADDLDFETEAAAAGASGIKFAVVSSGSWAHAIASHDHLAAATGGQRVDVGGSFESQVTDLILDTVASAASNGIPALRAHARAVEVDQQPLNLVVEEADALVEPGPGHDHQSFLSVPLPTPLDGSVTVLDDEARGEGGPGYVGAFADSTIAKLDLFNGLIVGEALHAHAEAVIGPGGAYAAVTADWAYLDVAGNTVVATFAQQDIPLPGGLGFVRINEQRIGDAGVGRQEAEINLIHVFITTGGTTTEVIIGHAYAGVTCDGDLQDAHGHGDGGPVCLPGGECVDLPCDAWSDCLGDPCLQAACIAHPDCGAVYAPVVRDACETVIHCVEGLPYATCSYGISVHQLLCEVSGVLGVDPDGRCGNAGTQLLA